MPDKAIHNRNGSFSASEYVECIRKGDTATFERLFLMYYNPLCRFVNKYLNSTELSEDVVQEVFAKIWENREDWVLKTSLQSYLYKACKNKALDHIKHIKVKQRYLQENSDQEITDNGLASDPLEKSDFIRDVQKAIEQLPKRSKLIYKLHRQDGLTYREISEVLEISQKTVESQMSIALKTLRKKLSSYVS